MRRVVVAIKVIAIVFLLAGCEIPRDNQPSVLVLAVEGLSFESLSCDAEETTERTMEGLRPMCEEAVRFSHAFAPSTMSQATMASLMTGLYPFDHGVRHNGSDFLSARFRTLAEGALSKGYHTLFVSGGAPIWRKSGLAQGFEVFDDTMDLSLGNYYRPSEDVVRLATNWLDHEALGTPFLGVLYFNDLQFPHVATRSREGEVRERTSAGQLEEIFESIGGVIQWLKSRHKWNSTHVVLVGLSSLEHPLNDNEPKPLNLKSASVQVSLLVKPARKEKDNVQQWAVDKNVSLVDVGRTMHMWLGLEPQASSVVDLEPLSLVDAVTKAAPSWKEDRLILSESAWPDWLEGSGVRTAIRQNRFLYIDDQRPLIFNTLTDRNETLALKMNDPLWISLNAQVVGLLKKANTPKWKGMNDHWLEQIDVARELWRNDMASRPLSGREAWSKWYMRRALRVKDWRELKRLSQEIGEPVGTFVAGRHLGDNMPVPRNACVRLLLGGGGKGDKHDYQPECEDELVLALHSWQTARGDDEGKMAQDRFIKLYGVHLMDLHIGRLNFLNELRWDVDRESPEGPQVIDYVLTMKELEPFNKKTLSLLSNKDVTF